MDILALNPGFSKAQYPWREQAAFLAACREAERNLACGAMEYMSDDEASETLADNVVHPWVMVQKGGEVASMLRSARGDQQGGIFGTFHVAHSLGRAGDLEGDKPVCKV